MIQPPSLSDFALPEHLALSTVRISCKIKSGGTSVGTGFFFNFPVTDNRFIPTVVTNKHVIKDSIAGDLLFTQADSGNLPMIGTVHPHSIQNFETGWILHPDPEVDLCVMPIGWLLNIAERAGTPYCFRGFDTFNLPPLEKLQGLAALDSVVMIGYPVGIWDDKNNMPIFRKGIAATHPYLDYQGRKEFMIDMACFPGSSGSPVLLIRHGLSSDKHGRNLVGTTVMLLGILYAGPQFTAEGQIVVRPIPTNLEPVPITSIPANLGYVIKSERLLEFEPLLKRPTVQ